MAKEQNATRARIENIKTELRSTSTCTTGAVTALGELLTGEKDVAQKENVNVKNTKPSGLQSGTRRRAGAAVVKGNAGDPGASLVPRERYILATEVANITLKSLTDALKAPSNAQIVQPQPQSKSTSKSATRPPSPSAHTKSLSTSSHPLKERPVSQITNSPTKPTTAPRSSSPSQNPSPNSGLVAVAECARLAFSYLGTAEAVKVAGKETPELQLENGLLALVGKLVAHGLDNLALKELRVLKRRLDKYIVHTVEIPDSRSAINRTARHEASAVQKESLATLLDFGLIDPQSTAASIVGNMQLYTLRVFARLKRSRLIEASWKYLKLSYQSSPANLIWYMAKYTDHRAKSARQLESLAQTILSLCPSIASVDDQEQLQPSPDIVLCLQHLAFRVRQRWWTLAQHQGDREKEILEPFTKCLVTFARRSTFSALQKFKLAESLYTDLYDAGKDANVPKSMVLGTSALACKTLSLLARAAELPDDALRWMGADTPCVEESTTRNTIRLVRIAAMSLEAFLKSKKTKELDTTSDTALEALSGSLGGSTIELNELLLEVSTLRRVASRILASNSSTTAETIPEHLRHQCIRIVTTSVRFTSRYIGTCPTSEDDPRILARYQERVGIVSKLMKSTIDSVMSCCRQPVLSETHWVEIDALVQDFINLMTRLQDSEQESVLAFQDASHSPFVKISNAYWAIYLQIRKFDTQLVSSTLAMQQSIAVLQSRPHEERKIGLLTMKLERLGEVLDQLSRTEESREALAQCIQTSLNDGFAHEIAHDSSSQPIGYIFDDGRELSNLGRMLKSYHRSFQKSGLQDSKELAFFDDCTHPPAVRGALLEFQFGLYQRTLSRNRQWDSNLNPSLQILVDRLLSLYSHKQFPIRYQRVHLMLCHFLQSYPGIISANSSVEDYEPPDTQNISGTEDHSLQPFGAHLKALIILQKWLRVGDLSAQALNDCFSTWQQMVDSAPCWDHLLTCVDNVDQWLEALHASADFLDAKGKEYDALPVLHLLVRIQELKDCSDPSELITVSCTLALHYLRLGYSGKAGSHLIKSRELISASSAPTEAKLRWHIAYAEYLLRIGDINKCETTLATAEQLARGDAQFMDLAKPTTSLAGRVRFHRIVADACYVTSVLCSTQGDFKHAARHAKQCVILNRNIWAALESRTTLRNTTPETSDLDSQRSTRVALGPLTTLRNDQATPVTMSITHDALRGAEFWSLVSPLYRALEQHSETFVSQGLLQEAVYIAEQAEKIACAIGSSSLQMANASRLANLWLNSGRVDKAQSLLESASRWLCTKEWRQITYHTSMATMYRLNNKPQEELATYDAIEKLLGDLSSSLHLTSMERFTSSVDDLTKEVAAMSLQNVKPGGGKPLRSTRGRSQVPKAVARTIPKAASRAVRKPSSKPIPTTTSQTKDTASEHGTGPTGLDEQCALLLVHQTELIYQRVIAHLLQDDVPKAMELLKSISIEGDEHAIAHTWIRFKVQIAQATKNITEDFTFNTLPESTIALPSVPPEDRRSSEVEIVQRPKARTTAKAVRGKKPVNVNFIEELQQARENLVEAHARCAGRGTNHDFQKISAALSQATVLLSAISRGRLRGSLHPLYSAYMSEVPKLKALKFAQDVIEVEQEKMSREQYLQWPKLESERSLLGSVADFQHEYIDMLPESWNAISLGLNDERNELYITRYESHTSPFVLRLPLARHSSRDMDEEEFSFIDGKQEFEEIIELSDFSTRNAKDMTTREARLQWWSEREALDIKLRDLLVNMENIWLGGFKGIFSNHVRQPALLARFQKSFEGTLNSHLPSRRKKGPRKRTNLDPRVLELFVGLGDASKEEADFDEALVDLIYFVVDILQFNGEPNAYDEIDFDAMVIETMDALRAYHNAAKDDLHSKTHTILILDKNLHMFPWESLPCLEKLSISRLPSLAALRERLLTARSPSMSQGAQPGHYISAEAGGASILNPSGDLSHTMKTIKPRLDEMKGSWTHIINRAPSEKEFEDSLRDEEVVLYFGHGSGAQFVRSKSVRRLYVNSQRGEGKKPGCSTVFLFGCSSVHLSENGIYEPSGMLASYLTAGAPAVVGMLWDVTDKDCDRLAVKAGELWGLWPDTTEEANMEPPTTSKKTKAKSRVAQLVEEVVLTKKDTPKRGRKTKAADSAESTLRRERRRGIGLDEAIRDARDACVLRYLNGAAAVVYGIPTYLE